MPTRYSLSLISFGTPTIIFDPPESVSDVHCPGIFKLKIMQVNLIRDWGLEIGDFGNFYAKGRATGGTPAFDDTDDFISPPAPLKGPRLLRVRVAGVTFYPN